MGDSIMPNMFLNPLISLFIYYHCSLGLPGTSSAPIAPVPPELEFARLLSPINLYNSDGLVQIEPDLVIL